MSGKPFFDTTILIYAVSNRDPRATVAQDLLASGGYLSVQVLNEFAVVARRKLKMSWREIGDALAAFRTLCEPVMPLTVAVHEAALDLAAKTGINIYDALILSAAVSAKCTVLYSEDMQHGQRIGPLVIRNPFKAR